MMDHFDIACFLILFKFVADYFRDIHERIVPFVRAIDLSLILQSFLVNISHKVIDSFVVMDKEKILKLSMLFNRDNNFILDDDFAKFSRVSLINYSNLKLVTQKADVKESFNKVVTKELIAHDVHFVVIKRFFADSIITYWPQTNRNYIFLANLDVENVINIVLEGVKCLIVSHLHIDLHEQLH